jgi:regulator of cell morphogenesis and NO signaling
MITSHSDALPDCTIAEIALDFPQSIRILNRYHIDFCCAGKKLFRDVCQQHHINPDEVWGEIVHELPIPAGNLNRRFESWDVAMLIDFIEQNHHAYIRIMIPQLRDLIGKIRLNHEDQYPELADIETNFNFLAEELLDHLPKEEEIIFPAIRRLVKSPVSASRAPLMTNLQTPIMVIEQEHQNAANLLKLLRSLTNYYKAPAHACPTFQLMYRLLEEFDEDLVQHIHLENNVLFAKVKF